MKILLIGQAIVALLLTISILLQNRGSGLGGAFGGDFGNYYAKRGLEKFLLYATVFLVVLFIGLSIASARYTAV
jgi:protein translocase SecG subunit